MIYYNFLRSLGFVETSTTDRIFKYGSCVNGEYPLMYVESNNVNSFYILGHKLEIVPTESQLKRLINNLEVHYD